MKTSTITSINWFIEEGHIHDMIAIDDANYLLAAEKGLLKTTKDQLVKHYYKGKAVESICHITHSFYLVGSRNDGLNLWNEHTDQWLMKIYDETIFSIKRVLTTNSFIIKSFHNGLWVVTIDDLKSLKFSMKFLLYTAEMFANFNDSLQVQIT